jgi:uncharacterized protein YndB with AHSA1/START domain
MQVTLTLAPEGAGTLAPEGAGTRITRVILFPTLRARAGALRFGADRLGQTTLARLAALAETGDDR